MAQAASAGALPGGARAGRVASYALLLVITAIYLAPFLWMVSTSLKSATEATTVPPTLAPAKVDTSAYERVTGSESSTPVLRWFLNSVLAGVANTALVLATAAPAAYALARMDFRGKRVVFGIIVGTLFIPPIILLIPNYLIVSGLRWLDTLLAVIVPSAATAFGVFFLRQFFLGLPRELEEAALIDGATHWQVFSRVVIPLAKPALATLAVLAFLTNWNDFLWPIYVLFSPDSLTLPPGLGLLQGAYTIDYPVIMAGGVIASIPVLLLFAVAQRYVIEGVARTGIKG
ncbi:MAG TPA: carbohydrate ABC transporter permease [Actinomycetota bacterium]|nr:carbohydrate ABC transporter permease [Actinomycetota bacterium]